MVPKRPNVLVIMTDEERYPPGYEADALAEFRAERLPARNTLRDRGVEFHRHYTASAACLPSRSSLFTGQYPSLHGVRNTDGLAKTADDPAMVWLDPDQVPTMGDWFRAAGYETHYRGKGFTIDVESKAGLIDAIDEVLTDPQSHEPDVDLARRYAHLFFFKAPYRSVAVDEPLPGLARITVDRLDDLGPGRDPRLDRLCDAVLGRADF